MHALTDFEWILALVTITASALVTLRLARFRTREERERAEAMERKARAYLSVLQILTQKTGGKPHSESDRAQLLELARSHGLPQDELGHLEYLLQRPGTRARLLALNPGLEKPTPMSQASQGGSDSRYLFSSFQAEIQKARESAHPLTLLTLSLLTATTEPGTPGGAPEERHLRRVAHLIRGQLRGRDTCVRHGSSEFIILLPGISKSEAAQMQNRLRIALQGATLSPGVRQASRSRIILGSATSPDDGSTFDQLLAIADEQRLRDGASATVPRTDKKARHFILDDKSLTRN